MAHEKTVSKEQTKENEATEFEFSKKVIDEISQKNIRKFIGMLSFKRESCEEKHNDDYIKFLDKFLKPLFGNPDTESNFVCIVTNNGSLIKGHEIQNSKLKLSEMPTVSYMAHHDTVHTSSGRQTDNLRYYEDTIEENPYPQCILFVENPEPEYEIKEVPFEEETFNHLIKKKLKKKGVKEVLIDKNENDQTNCLGADCTTGLWLMIEMINARIPGVYVAHSNEEVGCMGSQYLVDEFDNAIALSELIEELDDEADVNTAISEFNKSNNSGNTYSDEDFFNNQFNDNYRHVSRKSHVNDPFNMDSPYIKKYTLSEQKDINPYSFWIAHVDVAISFDRHSYTSIITFQSGKRTASDEFANDLSDILSGTLSEHGYESLVDDQNGSYTDSNRYHKHIAECTNLSVGYKNQHSERETQNVSFIIALRDALIKNGHKINDDVGIYRDRTKTENRVYGSRYSGSSYTGYGNTGYGSHRQNSLTDNNKNNKNIKDNKGDYEPHIIGKQKDKKSDTNKNSNNTNQSNHTNQSNQTNHKKNSGGKNSGGKKEDESFSELFNDEYYSSGSMETQYDVKIEKIVDAMETNPYEIASYLVEDLGVTETDLVNGVVKYYGYYK